MNPTTDIVEKRICLLEGAPEMGGVVCVWHSACFAIINCAQKATTSSRAQPVRRTYTMLPTSCRRWASAASSTPGAGQSCRRHQREHPRPLLQTLQPGARDQDLEAIAKVAHDAGLPLIVDATFSTPPPRRSPTARTWSATADEVDRGHGTGIGGIVVDKDF